MLHKAWDAPTLMERLVRFTTGVFEQDQRADRVRNKQKMPGRTYRAIFLCTRCRNSEVARYAAFLISIFFSFFWACAFFGSVTVRTPFLKFASILLASTPEGTVKERWNEPNRRSET